MLSSRFKPKYKILKKLKLDLWNTLEVKKFDRTKWKNLIEKIKERKKSLVIPKVLNYQKKQLSSFPVYLRYSHKNFLFTRLQIKSIYGPIQHYKIKKVATNVKKKSWINYIRDLEQTPSSFLFRIRLFRTHSEGLIHNKYKRIFISNKVKKKIKEGDTLHFRKDLENLLRRRLVSHYFRAISNIREYLKYLIKLKNLKKLNNPENAKYFEDTKDIINLKILEQIPNLDDPESLDNITNLDPFSYLNSIKKLKKMNILKDNKKLKNINTSKNNQNFEDSDHFEYFEDSEDIKKLKVLLNFKDIGIPDGSEGFKDFNTKEKELKKVEIPGVIYLGIQTDIDFDVNTFSFFFFRDIVHFKNHPFKIPFADILRWYTRT